jgi:hypothetical protein
MDRDELKLAIAGALFGALLIGWILHWMFARINRAEGPRSIRRTADMASRLHAAEIARSRAETRLAEVEGDLRQRLADTERELDTALRSLERERARSEEIRDAYRAASGSEPPAA